MKREIKFRVWDGTGMRQPTNNILIDSFDGTANWQFAYDEPKPMWDWLVMQYTGLKDKNGVEIYEGDIIPFDFDRQDVGDFRIKAEGRLNAVVTWNESETTYEARFKESKKHNIVSCTMNAYNCKNREVIGNIHQNPELV